MKVVKIIVGAVLVIFSIVLLTSTVGAKGSDGFKNGLSKDDLDNIAQQEP